MPAAQLNRFHSTGKAFGQKPKALEDGSVAEANQVSDEIFVVGIIAAPIGCEAIGNRLDAATDRRAFEHVDVRMMRIRNWNSRLTVPDVLRVEGPRLIRVLQQKECTVPLLALLTHRLCGHLEDILEELFGQGPVLRCCAAADVGRCEEFGNEHPRVIEDSN